MFGCNVARAGDSKIKVPQHPEETLNRLHRPTPQSKVIKIIPMGPDAKCLINIK